MATITDMNKYLDPVLFQVIGSTPESIRDSLMKSTVKGQPAGGLQLAVIAVFSSAVNKATMETFASKPELAEARGFMNTVFSISGRANMTGLTLLGHCLMTTTHMSSINFCAEFRKKMGQDHLWAGNLESGSLSDKQKEILKEKKRVVAEESAKLLGSGYFKFIGVDSNPMTVDESIFWKQPVPGRAQRSSMSSGIVSPSDATKKGQTDSRNLSISGSPKTVARETIDMQDGTTVSISSDVLEYYRKFVSSDEERLVASIAKRGAARFENEYKQAMLKDPDGNTLRGSTIVV